MVFGFVGSYARQPLGFVPFGATLYAAPRRKKGFLRKILGQLTVTHQLPAHGVYQLFVLIHKAFKLRCVHGRPSFLFLNAAFNRLHTVIRARAGICCKNSEKIKIPQPVFYKKTAD